MPPASPVPGWSSGEVCRLIIASRCSSSTPNLLHDSVWERSPPRSNPDVAGLIPPGVRTARSGGVRAPRMARLPGAVAGRSAPAHQEAGRAVDDHQGADDLVHQPVV